MKSKFSAIFALALTAMLIAVPLGGGESDAADQVDAYSKDMDDAALVAYVQDSTNRGKLLSFEGDSDRTLNFTGNQNLWHPDVNLAGKTITISISTCGNKHALIVRCDSFAGGTGTQMGTVIFDHDIPSNCSCRGDYRGFSTDKVSSEGSDRTVVYSNLNIKWSTDITTGGALARSSEKAHSTFTNCHFGSESSSAGIGLYLNGSASDLKNTTIDNCTFTNLSKPVAVDGVTKVGPVTITGDCPDIFLELASQTATEVSDFLSRVTFPAGSDPVVKIKSSQGYSDVTVVAPLGQYTISFDVLSSTITATEGQPVSLPALPVKEGYYAVGWAYNGTLVGYMFTVTDSNVVLTACYEPIPAGDGEPIVIPGSSQTVIEEASLGTDDIVVIAMCVLALLVLGFLFFIIKTS